MTTTVTGDIDRSMPLFSFCLYSLVILFFCCQFLRRPRRFSAPIFFVPDLIWYEKSAPKVGADFLAPISRVYVFSLTPVLTLQTLTNTVGRQG